MGIWIVNSKAKGGKEMQTLGKKKESSFVKTVPKQATMKTIAGLHPELKPEKFKNKDKAKEKGKTVATVEQELGFESGDKTKSISMVLRNIKGK